MIRRNRRLIAAVVLALAFTMVLFQGLLGRGVDEADPAAVDAHLQQLRAEKAAEQQEAVAAARSREAERERALKEKVSQRGS